MDHWIHLFLQVHIMLLPRLPVLSALLLLLLAAGRCTKVARRRSTGTLDGRSMLEQVGRYPRSRTEPVGLSGVRTPGHGQYLNSCCYWYCYWYYWWCSCEWRVSQQQVLVQWPQGGVDLLSFLTVLRLELNSPDFSLSGSVAVDLSSF